MCRNRPKAPRADLASWGYPREEDELSEDHTTNGCNHPNTVNVREGDDEVTRCTASGCGAEVSRVVGWHRGRDD